MAAGAPESAVQSRRLRFARSSRLRKRFEFRRVRDMGSRVHTHSFLLLLRKNDGEGQRLGVTVTKQVAGAVGRNRIKRLVREVFRQNPNLFPEQSDVVVVAKRDGRAQSYDAVRDELRRARDSMRVAMAKGPARPRGAK